MRKIVVALTALMGLIILAGSFNLFVTPVTVVFAGLPFWQSVIGFVLALLPGVASVALAIYLIRGRERIATWYLPDDHEVPPASAESLLRVGLVLLGVYLVVQALPEILALAILPVVNSLQLRADTIFGSQATETSWRWLIQSIPRIVSSVASLVIGYALLAKRELIITRIFRDGVAQHDGTSEGPAYCSNCGAGYDPTDYEGGVVAPRCENCKEVLEIPRT